MNKNITRFFKPVIIFFIIISVLILVFAGWLDKNKIDHSVLFYANFILLVLIIITGFLHIKAVANNNPYAFVRSITMSAFLKLIVIAVSVLIYLNTAGENKSIYAVGAAMMLYIIYTILEVKGAMQLNRKKNAES